MNSVSGKSCNLATDLAQYTFVDFAVIKMTIKSLVLSATVALASAQGNYWSWCTQTPQSGWAICNPAADINARAASIVSQLSVQDKINALGTSTPALNSIGFPGKQTARLRCVHAYVGRGEGRHARTYVYAYADCPLTLHHPHCRVQLVVRGHPWHLPREV